MYGKTEILTKMLGQGKINKDKNPFLSQEEESILEEEIISENITLQAWGIIEFFLVVQIFFPVSVWWLEQ